MMCSRKCEQVDLEKLSLNFKHADYALICRNLIVVIENTSRPKSDDVEKIVNTIKWLHNQHKPQQRRIFVGILHCSRRVKPEEHKSLNSNMQKLRSEEKIKATFKIAKCDNDLKTNWESTASANLPRSLDSRHHIVVGSALTG